MPILSYGVRAYVDIPYLLLVLGALLVESRRRRAGAPVLVLLALAGLLRPEAWAFSGLYWLYLLPGRDAPAGLARLTLLAAAAPLVWLLSDLAITGDPLWSLTNTRHTAETLDRVTGIAQRAASTSRVGSARSCARRCSSAPRSAACCRCCGCARARSPVRPRGSSPIVVFAAFADDRAADQHALRVPRRGDPVRLLRRWCVRLDRGWPAGTRAGAGGWRPVRSCSWRCSPTRRPVPLGAPRTRQLARQQSIQDDLLALVDNRSIALRCGPVGVPNHAPIPLLALYLKTSPANIVQRRSNQISSRHVRRPGDRRKSKKTTCSTATTRTGRCSVPPGFTEVARQPLVADLQALLA